MQQTRTTTRLCRFYLMKSMPELRQKVSAPEDEAWQKEIKVIRFLPPLKACAQNLASVEFVVVAVVFFYK